MSIDTSLKQRNTSLKQRNKALTLAHAQTIYYTSNYRLPHRGACQAECVRSAPFRTPHTTSLNLDIDKLKLVQ